MNKTNMLLMAAAMTIASSCGSTAEEKADSTPVIGKQEVTLPNARMTPEALWAMGRIGSVAPSPDGSQIAYTVSYYSVTANKSHRVIYVMN
ncbi:MAG: peptidase S9, partial [Phocaeicola sp.]